MKLDRLAGREEDHQLLGAVLLQEGKEKEESHLRRAHHISLSMSRGED